jgi:hypothetical protein
MFYVYVVYATENGEHKECSVYWRRKRAWCEYMRLRSVYGGESAVFASRRLLW